MSEEEARLSEPSGLRQGVRNQTDIDIIMCLRKAVTHTFSIMCHLDIAEKPRIELKPVVRWQGKMRIIKPIEAAFVSVITFKNPSRKLKKYEVNGIIILYIPGATVDIVLPAMGLGMSFDEDDIKDACGEFLNVVAGSFKTELVKNGYEEMEISTPVNFGCNVDELFDYYQDHKFEITFFKDGQQLFQVDVGLNELSKIQ
ncbi:MAG: chemotaxis protein CheX [Candidatus Omnitrophota bacterium]